MGPNRRVNGKAGPASDFYYNNGHINLIQNMNEFAGNALSKDQLNGGTDNYNPYPIPPNL